MYFVKVALALSLLLSPSSAWAAQRAKENKRRDGTTKPQSFSLEAEILRSKAAQLLNSLDQGVSEVAEVPDRVRVMIEIADAVWLADKERARHLFERSFNEVDKLSSDSQIKHGRAAELMQALRYRVLLRAARRDPELANRLVRSLPDATPTEEQKWADTYGGGTPSSEALLGVAQNLLGTDSKQSVELAKHSLGDGLSQGLRLYLIDLRAKTPAAADALVEAALAAASTRRPGRLFEALILWEYAYLPASLYFGGISWDRGRNPPQYATPASLKRAALRFAIAAVRDNARGLTIQEAATDRLAQEKLTLLYSVVRQILPSVEADAPGEAAHLHAVASSVEQQLRAGGRPLPASPPAERADDKAEAEIDKLLKRAADMGMGEARDDLYLKIAFKLFQEREYERASQVAAKIDDRVRREAILEPINFNHAGQLIANSDIEEAIRVAARLQAPELRVAVLARAGKEVLDEGNVARGTEVLGEAQALAAKSDPSVALAASVLGIAMAYDRHDQLRSFEVINLAVEMINKLKSDGSLWALLSAPGGAGPLIASNFNWQESADGGLKSIKVNYPRAAGLVEVLSKASQRDFDQVVQAAKQIKAKGLSFAVQAALCRAALDSVGSKVATGHS
jgi:hypothetical protein